MRKPIRVLQVVTIMNRGGLETMLMNYYRHIDRSKVQFDFLVHRDEPGAYDDEIKKLGGRIYKMKPISLKNLYSYRRDLKTFFIEHPEYKIVHSHLDALSALPLYIAKKSGIQTRIAHSHNTNFDKNYKTLLRHILKRYIKYVVTYYVGCSTDAIRYMFGKNIRNYLIINNAIEVANFAFNPIARAKKRRQIGIPPGSFVVGNVGRFEPQKNHSFLIDIFNSVHSINDNSVLLLVGDGSLRKNIELKVNSLGLEDSVRFLGSRADVADLMQAMDCFVMPSKFEGLPVVSVEAQASGQIAFFADTITRDIIATDNCHFISLNNTALDWANQITSIDITNRKDESNNISRANFNITKEVENLYKLYLLNKTEFKNENIHE